ncbi:snRNA-activating protein complex subunit 4 isoform X2 [Stigmatopora nigra]
MSLCEWRERLQQEVDDLQRHLCASQSELQQVSSDDTDGESGVDMDQEAGLLTVGLLAKKKKIQLDIQKLENLLGSDVSSDDDSSGESELDLSNSVESCLQMNLVYQQILEEKLKQLESFLMHNQRQQKEAQFHLAGSSREALKEQPPASAMSAYPKQASLFLGHFLKPYFKDKVSGLGPPPNQDAKEKMMRMKGCLDSSKIKFKRWESWQKTLLIHSVTTDTLRKLVQPKLSRVDYLSQKLSSTNNSEEEKQQLKMHLQNLEKDIEAFKVKKEGDLLGDRDEEHDWQKIAKIDFEGTREADDLRLFWQNFLHPAVNKNLWSADEVEQLKEISGRNRESNWDLVARELGTGRTAFMCLQTFQRFISTSLKRGLWTPAEDRQFTQMVDKMRIGNFIPYTQISYFMDGRDPHQLIHRWTSILDPRLKKGTWSKEEDQLLLKAVARHGEKNWWKIRLEVPGRTDGSCRDRYLDCLKEGTKKGAFDRHERQLLIQLMEKYGEGRWSKIAMEIPNRNDAQCLREWKKIMRHANEPSKKRNRGAPETTARANKVKRRVPARRHLRKVQADDEESSLEEDEEEDVHYMDTDDEKPENEDDKNQEEEDNLLDREEVEQVHYPIPPLHLWIPLNENPQSTYPQIKHVTLNSGCGMVEAVRSTMVTKSGSVTAVGPPPQELRQKERHVDTAALMISEEELRLHLSHQASKRNKLRSLLKKGHVTNTEMDYLLRIAILPWVGNVLAPSAAPSATSTLADALGRETAVSSTPLFMLLLRAAALNISGCKDVILRRGQEKVTAAGQLPPPPAKSIRPPRRMPAYLKNPASVGAMLHASRAGIRHNPPLVCLLSTPPAPSPLLIQPQISSDQLGRSPPLTPALCLLTPPPLLSQPSQTLPPVSLQSQMSPHFWKLIPTAPSSALPVYPMTTPPRMPAAAPPSVRSKTSGCLRPIIPRTPLAHPSVHLLTTQPVSVFPATPPLRLVAFQHESKVSPVGKKREREMELPDRGKRIRKLTDKAVQFQDTTNKRSLQAQCGDKIEEGKATLVPSEPVGQNVVLRLPPPPGSSSPVPPRNIDPSLVFLESSALFGDWLRGLRGVATPHADTSLPYLPLCCTNLMALAVILRNTEQITRTAHKLVHVDTPPDQTVQALRTLVQNRLGSDPVFSLLKARFLSAFTLPALAAAVPPITIVPPVTAVPVTAVPVTAVPVTAVPVTAVPEPPSGQREKKKGKTAPNSVKGHKPPAQLVCDGLGAPAHHFSGMTAPALGSRSWPPPLAPVAPSVTL